MHKPPTRPASILSRTLPVLVVVLFLILFRAAAVAGPDFDHYLHWERAFRTLDTGAFLSEGQTLSPMGVPLSQWSHGPGLIYALCPAVCDTLMSANRQALWIGWAFTVIFWWAMAQLLRRAAYGDMHWTVYGILVAIAGTHAGFYSRSYASETFSQTILGVMVLWTVTRKDWRVLDTLLVGCLAALLTYNRSQLAIYALPPLVGMTYQIWRARSTRSASRTALLLGLPLVPLLIGLAQVGLTNRWMTGSVLGSPYSFGNAAFRSLNLARPELAAVLFHPLHGWLSTHPLYLVAFAALVLLALRARSTAERLFYAGYAIVIVVHIYLQAAWYVWWLGLQTFGMRGLGVSAVVLVPALIRVMRDREVAGKSYNIWGILTLAACLWSAPLFAASLTEEVQFFSYAEMLHFYATSLRPATPPLAVLVLALIATVWVARLRSSSFRDQLAKRPLLTVSLLVLCPTTVYALLRSALRWYAPGWGMDRGLADTLALISIPLCVALMALFLSAPNARDKAQTTESARAGGVETIIAVGLILALLGTAVVYARLAVHVESQIAGRVFPVSGVQYVAATHVDEVEQSFFEYSDIPGFEAKKAALKDYMLKLKSCSAVGSKAEILPRLMGLPRATLPKQVAFGPDLLLSEVSLVGGVTRRSPTTFRPGDFAGVATKWDVLHAMAPQKFSLRLLDAGGRQWAASDYWPKVGCDSVDEWQAAKAQSDTYSLELPPELPPGSYQIALVIYEAETGAVLWSGSQEVVPLAEIRVTDRGAS
jgi:hypothetical protein